MTLGTLARFLWIVTNSRQSEPTTPPKTVSFEKKSSTGNIARLRLRLTQKFHFTGEVTYVGEAFVYGSKPNIGNRIDVSETFEDAETDALGRNIGGVEPHSLFDIGGDLFDEFGLDRQVFRRCPQARHNLGPIERLSRPVSFDHGYEHFFEPLVSREPATARKAFAATADNQRIV
jgi:hypothetical protein